MAADGLTELSVAVARGRIARAPRHPGRLEVDDRPPPQTVGEGETKAPSPRTKRAAALAPAPSVPDLSETPAPQWNMTIRVPIEANERLEALLYSLRRTGVRSSKNEIIGALLMELPESPDPEILHALQRFRAGR